MNSVQAMPSNVTDAFECVRLGACPFPSPKTLNRLSQLVAAGPDWDTVLRLARQHRVRPLLADNLKQLGPEVLPEALRTEAKSATVGSLFQIDALLNLVDRLNAWGIDIIPYKGPALSAWAFGHPGLRESGDLDILVRPDEVDRTLEALAELGYESLQRLTTSQKRAERRSSYHCQLHHPSRGVIVEVHWGIALPGFVQVDLHRLFEQAKPIIMLGDRYVLGFPSEDLLVLLSAHGFKHRWSRLGWIADIAAIAHHQPPDWQAVQERAEAAKASTMLNLALWLANAVFGTPVPEPMAASLAADRTCQRLGPLALTALPTGADSDPRLKLTEWAPWLTASRGWSRRLVHSALALDHRDIAALPPALQQRCPKLGYLIRPVRLVHRHGSWFVRLTSALLWNSVRSATTLPARGKS